MIAAIGTLAAVLGNTEKLLTYAQRMGAYGSGMAMSAALSVPFVRDRVAARLLRRTYEGLTCLEGTQRFAARPEGWNRDLAVTFRLAEAGACGRSDDQPDSVVSAAVYTFDDWGYRFVDDISGHDMRGLHVGVHGPFIVATRLETDFPDSIIFVVRENRLRVLRSVQGWNEDGEGDEIAQLDFEITDGCLSIQSAGDGTFRMCDDGQAPGADNPVSYDTALAFVRAEDGAVALSRGGTDGFALSCDGACTLYVEPLTRISPPTGCLPQENILRWQTFTHRARLDVSAPGDSLSGEVTGRFFCGDKPDVQLVYDGP